MKLSCVLIIDDSEADQFICRALLESYDPDMQILQAYDGQEALEMLDTKSSDRPEIIFLDINMPRMDGLSFLEAYDQREDSQNIVVIMLTTSLLESDRQRSLSYKCVRNYCVKPLDVAQLETLVEEA